MHSVRHFHTQWALSQVAEIHFYRATLCVSAVFAVARCPSVTLVYCIHTAEDIVKLFIWPGSPIILASIPNSKGNPFSGGAKYNGVEKIAILD